MLELGASSGGRHSMDTMLPSRRNLQGRPVTVCQNGVAVVADLERRIRKGSQIRRTRTLPSRYMH